MTSGVAWIREQDYRWTRRRVIDGYLFPPAYQDWTATAEAEIRRFLAAGHIVEKIIIVPSHFEAWCRSNAQLCENAFCPRGGTAFAQRAGALILRGS
jgi:hypothetical protein